MSIDEEAQTQLNLAAIQQIRDENGWEKPEPIPAWRQVIMDRRNA